MSRWVSTRSAHAVLMTARQAVITWDESLRDPELFWSVIRPILIAFIASFASGLLVVLALNAPLLMQNSKQSVQEARPPETERRGGPATSAPEGVLSESRLAIPTRVEVTSAAGLLGPALAGGAPAATPLATPTSRPIATLAVAPTADAAWQAMLPSLDATWGTDTPATLMLLKAFHARFPEFQPAKEKLYAALVASAEDLAQRGASDDAEGQLTLATALLPERLEASALLLAIAANPTPASGTDQQDQEPPSPVGQVAQRSLPAETSRPQVVSPARPTPTPRPALVPVPPSVPRAPLSTPTKIPFQPPAAP